MKHYTSGLSFPSFQGRKPVEIDFITYSPGDGECSAALDHEWIIACKEFGSANDLRLDVNSKTLLTFYVNIFDQLVTGQLKFSEVASEVVGVDELGELDIYIALKPALEAEMANNVKSELGSSAPSVLEKYVRRSIGSIAGKASASYYKDLKINITYGKVNSDIGVIFPLIAVETKDAKGNMKRTLHDHLSGVVLV